jgi:signal transduction histidine kinase
VNDLLVLAKAEQVDFLMVQPVDVGELAQDLVPRLRALGDRTWIVEHVPAPGRVAIEADSQRLSQAILNFAGNAVNHTVEGDEIELSIDVSGPPSAPRAVHFRVRDTGTGIDPDVTGHLFDRYRRGTASRAGRPDGVGIGLAIVDAIARAHGGSVGVESRPGHGALFTITIPASAPSSAAEAP